jgi:hypothetical protein
MRHSLVAAAVLSALALTGCSTEESAGGSGASGGSGESAGSGGGGSASTDPVTVEVTIEGDRVEPAGDRVDVAPGQPVEFVVDADAAGEMHVHSTPEQTIEFGAGTSEHTVTVDRPGVVEVELHDPELVVVQLEVR